LEGVSYEGESKEDDTEDAQDEIWCVARERIYILVLFVLWIFGRIWRIWRTKGGKGEE